MSQLLFSKRHVLYLFTQGSPITSLQLCVLDSFLAPVLVQFANVVLRLLEVNELVADAFLDKHASRMLIDYRLFVLQWYKHEKQRGMYQTVAHIQDSLFDFLLFPGLHVRSCS